MANMTEWEATRVVCDAPTDVDATATRQWRTISWLVAAALVMVWGCVVGAFVSGSTALGYWFLAVSVLVDGVAVVCYFAWRQQRSTLSKLTEENRILQLSDLLLSNLLADFPGYIYFKDRESRFLRISRTLTRAFRLECEEDAWGKTDLDIFGASGHAKQAFDDEQKIMRTGRPMIDFEEMEIQKDGQEEWNSTSKLPLHHRDGTIAGTFGVSLDVTKRRRAEAAARYERDLLHKLMDNIPDLIYFKDKNSRFVRINQSQAHLLGLKSPDEAIGKWDFDFFPAQFAQATADDERKLFESGNPILGKTEYDMRGKRWFLSTKVPIRNPSGEVSGLVGIAKDITERKLAEEKTERELQAFFTVVSAAAQGDLRARGAEGDDTPGRIAQSVNQMLDNFVATLARVRNAALSVSTSAIEIMAATTQITDGAKRGTGEVQATSSAVEEMACSMAEVSRNAEQSAETAKQVLEHLRQGRDSVNATTEGMARIDLASNTTAEKMRLLEKRSEQIFNIVAFIEDIASSSTLLSLNAAIAAAQAGDAGRGFGVVAEKIRQLADHSADSAKQVSDILKGIVEDTRLALAAMEKGTQEVRHGRELSKRAQDSMQIIQELVERSVSLSEQISHASHDQTKATQTVSQAMQTIATFTQESSDGAGERSRAVRNLVGLAEQLNQEMLHFKIGGHAPAEDLRLHAALSSRG